MLYVHVVASVAAMRWKDLRAFVNSLVKVMVVVEVVCSKSIDGLKDDVVVTVAIVVAVFLKAVISIVETRFHVIKFVPLIVVL